MMPPEGSEYTGVRSSIPRGIKTASPSAELWESSGSRSFQVSTTAVPLLVTPATHSLRSPMYAMAVGKNRVGKLSRKTPSLVRCQFTLTLFPSASYPAVARNELGGVHWALRYSLRSKGWTNSSPESESSEEQSASPSPEAAGRRRRGMGFIRWGLGWSGLRTCQARGVRVRANAGANACPWLG